MKKCLLVVAILFLIDTAYGINKVPTPFKVGEYMEFEIRLFGKTVAIQKVWVKGIVEVRGRKCYHILADIQTVPWVSRLYHLHDIANEYIDVKTLLPLKIRTKIKEGKWINNVKIDVHQKYHFLRYKDKRKKVKVKYKGEVVGLISMIYYARTLDPKKNEKITFTLSNGSKIVYVNVTVEDTEAKLYLKDLKKEFTAILYRQHGGRNVELWISRDKYRLPIRMISVKLKLAGYGITNIEAWLTKHKA